MIRSKGPLRHRAAKTSVNASLSTEGRLRRYAWISGMGLSVLAGTAHAAAFGTPAWLAQAKAVNTGSSAANGGSAPAIGGGSAVITPQQAQQLAQRSIGDLARAAAAVAQANAAQVLAHQNALNGANSLGADPNHPGQLLPNVPDGLQKGGLDPLDPGSWINAKAPSSSQSGGKTTVTVQQTAQKAILNWNTFNVGKNTALDFDQSRGNQTNGGNNWIALNRVMDPNARPTQILGSIKAQGSVYIINENGIIFGGSSQVNTHSLLASALEPFAPDVASSNAAFLSNGIAASLTGVTFIQGAAANAGSASVQVQAGARLSSGSQGYILLAAPDVSNAGQIVADSGQAVLLAGTQIGGGGVNAGQSADSSGLFDFVVQAGGPNGTEGRLSNTGLIQARTGSIALDAAFGIVQDGVLYSTTSVSQPGSIALVAGGIHANGNLDGGQVDTSGPMVLGPHSVIAILPEENGETTTSSSAADQVFQPSSVILRAGSITFQNGSLLEAPGANVTVAAFGQNVSTTTHLAANDPSVPGRIYLDDGATVDVSGLADVQLPMSDTLLTLKLTANELADSPLQRDGFLVGQTVTVDTSVTGTRADGSTWVGSPLLNIAANVQAMPRSIDQLLLKGGSVNLSGAEVLAQQGSTINLSGGYAHYLEGGKQTTKLLGADGKLYDISLADPGANYVGIAGQHSLSQPRWNLDPSYTDPILSGALGAVESDYIQGANAGALNVSSGVAALLDGNLLAAAYAGRHQVPGGSQPLGGTLTLSGPDGAGYPLGQNAITPLNGPSYLIQNGSLSLSAIAPDFNADTALSTPEMQGKQPYDSSNVLYWSTLSADAIANGGFSVLKITTPGQIVVQPGTTLGVHTGTSGGKPADAISLQASTITVDGTLSAPAGSIALTATGYNATDLTLAPGTVNPGGITLGAQAQLSARGQWVNDAGLAGDQQTGDAYINGGSIALVTRTSTRFAPDGSVQDGTGSIVMQQGSILDVSSGGYVQPNGQLLASGGVPQGQGGNITLATHVGGYTGGGNLPTGELPTGGQIGQYGANGQFVSGIFADLRAYGFSGGGTLTLRDLDFQIGGDPKAAPAYALYLPADYFQAQGFGSYVLMAEYDATIASGAKVAVSQRNFIPGNYGALLVAPTGTDLYGRGTTEPDGSLVSLGTLDPYLRQPTSFTLQAGDFLTWDTGSIPGTLVRPSYAGVSGAVLLDQGASIQADPGATVALYSPAQVTVLGSVTAHGGHIILSTDTVNADGESAGAAAPAVGTGAGQYSAFAGYTAPGKSVWLGEDAVLDVSGIALTNPLTPAVPVGGQNGPAVTGKVLKGGSVVLSDDSGYVIAAPGSVIDVSGASATFDLPQGSGLAAGYAPQQVWSDAGSVTLAAASGLYFDGTLRAQGGAGQGGQGQGGSLSILGVAATTNTSVDSTADTLASSKNFDGLTYTTPGATAIILQQGGDELPAGLAPGEAVESAGASGTLYFAVDRLAYSGIANLGIDSRGLSSNSGPVPLAFVPGADGKFNLSLSGSFTANASEFAVLPAGSTSLASLVPGLNSVGGATVTIAAPYVALEGINNVNFGTLAQSPALADGTLKIEAGSFLDLEGHLVLANFANADFSSGGDIRFSAPADFTNSNSGAAESSLAGSLYTPGSLSFSAAQLYPSSGTSFAIVANAQGLVDASGNPVAPASVTIAGNGQAAATPLSAGGALLIDADSIVQNGTLRAPSGQLVLGVGTADTGDAATLALFGNLPLIATRSVTLGAGSLTSVSLDGTTVPYGTTVDGKEWQYNVNASGNPADVSAPPDKLVSINGAEIHLNGGTVDLKGGGDLQAEEWVPGTGGSRDLLSSYNTSYASGSAQQVPLYADGRDVYAVVPGYAAPVAAYDPVYAQAPGAAGTTQLGVGQAGLQSQVGKAVYLSGVPGLAAGVYTLLPAKYATLPGAYRVVVQGAQDLQPSQDAVERDGSALVAGYFVDALSGARDARSTTFVVQSRPVWEQYSQYTLSSADSFFPALAAHAGSLPPPLPQDAGHLILGASASLGLDGTQLATTPANGGALAQVDIASQDIAVVSGQGQALPDGYLQLQASDLEALDAGSLLLGGTRSTTAQGVTISALANSIIVANDASHPLNGPETILVTRADPDGSDPNAATGLQLRSGSVITASGQVPAGTSLPITILKDASSGLSDGALLRVSNGAQVVVTRQDATPAASAQGLLDIQAGAQLGSLAGGAVQSLTLDASGNVQVDPAAVLGARSIAADSSNIVFVNGDAAPAGATGLILGSSSLQELAQAQELILRSSGGLDFEGNVNLDLGSNTLELSAGTFSAGAYGSAGQVQLSAGTLALGNDLGAAPQAATAGGGSLALSAREIDFGAGGTQATSNSSFSGFGQIQAKASGGIAGVNGGYDFGAATVALDAPVIYARNGSATRLTTTGALSLDNGAGTALADAATALGGSLSLAGGSVEVSTLLQAHGGQVTLRAMQGDLTLAGPGSVNVSGIGKTFYDVTEYAPGGAISLSADSGSIVAQSGSILDFSAADGGGDAGSLTVSATTGSASLAGQIKGGAKSGLGGSFSLDTGGAVDLDALAAALASSGANQLIAVRSGQGNLELGAGNTLSAATVQLTADGGTSPADAASGHVLVAGTIDASGARGGTIELYGKGGVDLEGTLRAVGSDPGQLGGNVTIGTSGTPDGTLNTQYGYENVDAAGSGSIKLGSQAVIDVSGGSAATIAADGLSGGTVSIRAPLLADGSVNVSIDPNARITGARDVGLEAYAVWSTADAGSGARHFDGIVDPAGWYDSQGQLLAGSFYDPFGNDVFDYTPGSLDAATLKSYLSQYYFTPAAPNTDHQGFYGYVDDDQSQGAGTLMGFVQAPGFTFENRFAGIQNFHARPGIELDSPAAAGGNISVLTAWNLGAGYTGGDGNTRLVYRYNGQAPTLTLRAADNLEIDASISDGFYASAGYDPLAVASPVAGFPSNDPAPVRSMANPLGLQVATLMPLSLDTPDLAGSSTSYRLVGGADLASADPLATAPAIALGAGGNVEVDNHALAYDPNSGRNLALPTLVRTGTGSIDIAAGGSFRLLDTVAPGAIYAGGVPAAGSPLDGTDLAIGTESSAARYRPEWLVTGEVHPVAAGDISISARGDVIGVEQVYDPDGSLSGLQGTYLGQFWWPWMQTGNPTGTDNNGNTIVTASSINFGNFDQGVMSVGGNVSVSAGGDIRDLSVSLPTTWYQNGVNASGNPIILTQGGGNLAVNAGGNILSGSYFVSKGVGRIRAGGNIGSDFTYAPLLATDPAGVPLVDSVSTLLALQDAQLQVSARGGADIGGVYNPSYQLTTTAPNPPDLQSYSADSALSISSTAGDVSFGTLGLSTYLFSESNPRRAGIGIPSAGVAQILPASLELTSLSGGVSVESGGELYPSPNGNFSLIADGSIDLYNSYFNNSSVGGSFNGVDYLGLVDASDLPPSPLHPQPVLDLIGGQAGALSAYQLHQSNALHGTDDQPVRVYSLNGDIIDGSLNDSGFYNQSLILAPDKPAQVYAGGDIVNLSFSGQNLRDSDVTRIVAGRDIYDPPLGAAGAGPGYYGEAGTGAYNQVPALILAGPGSFDVEAGRDLGPLTNQLQAISIFGFAGNQHTAYTTGIQTVGNLTNPYLGHQSASVNLLFGVAPGIDVQGFVARYIDPSAAAQPGVPSFAGELVSFMEGYEAGQVVDTGLLKDQRHVSLTAAQAWSAFQALPAIQQQLFAEQVFFKLLQLTAKDYNDPASPYFHQYARGYEAVNTLFPAALGYTANNLAGGANGAAQLVHTGDLDLRTSTVQTQQGGSIYLLGPGGEALLGSSSAPPVIIDPSSNQVFAGPNSIGVLTLERGDIDIFTDLSLLLAQSRVFTEQGGNVTIWSSNGDINAGAGAKTNSEIPPPLYLCDQDFYCTVDARGQVSGAGIASLQTIPGVPAGNAYLVAPRGTIDAGAAGIRVSGNLFLAAQHIANAFNIDVKGNTVGLPGLATDVNALSAANSAAGAAEKAAEDLATHRGTPPLSTVITVDVVGFGQPDEEQKKKLREKPL